MNYTHLVGVDPGIVHTGVVSILLTPETRHLHVRHVVIDKLDAHAVADWVNRDACGKTFKPVGFIEGYRPRNNLQHDRTMSDGVTRMREATGFKVLDNMGVKKIITPSIMQVLGVWSFTTITHHQDLRSAARIALLGLIKTDGGNHLVADVIRDHLDGQPWSITQ